MGYSVYLESTVVDLKPRVLDFLTVILEKAKEKKDYALAMRREEMAELIGRNTRTVSRYLNELEEKDIIETKGRRGRGGGTVILFNTELIKFNTAEDALVNSDDPETIEEVMERKIPKKEPKPRKRYRRTKQQMIEDKILQNEKQAELDHMNEQVEKLGGVPNWAWFKETNDPVGNYRTYLLSRLYNRYAALFSDKHNAEVDVYQEGRKVQQITNEYDVLPDDFYGSSRWNQFEKLRTFCEENSIEPDVYLSAQFSRSLFDSARKGNRNMLPFVNALTSDTSYEVYLQYCEYQKQVSRTYATYQVVPAQFHTDFVIQSIHTAYISADKGLGLLNMRHSINDFLSGEGSTEKEEALLGFYRLTSQGLKDRDVSFETRDTLKKYIMMQSLTLLGGNNRLPLPDILGAETTRAVMLSIDNQVPDKEEARKRKSLALGTLAHPTASQEERENKGRDYLYQHGVLNETPQVLRLIMERRKTYLSIIDINKALREYGKEKVPVDTYSIMDTSQIIKFMQEQVMGQDTKPQEEIRHEDITDTQEWALVGSRGYDDNLSDDFDKYLENL